MNRLAITSFLVLAAAASAPSVHGQAIQSTGDYQMDLGQLHGVAQVVKMAADLCSESYPELRLETDRRYLKWKASNLPLLQEIERHWQFDAMKDANGDPTKYRQFQIKYARTMESVRIGLKEWLNSEGDEAARGKCATYPTSLGRERTEISQYFSEHIATIRKRKLPF